jgi:hypothetical protein
MPQTGTDRESFWEKSHALPLIAAIVAHKKAPRVNTRGSWNRHSVWRAYPVGGALAGAQVALAAWLTRSISSSR